MNERSFKMPNKQDYQTRRRRLEEAALRLFAERGFHGVGMREIAKAAGLSLGNIYNHYPSKEPLFAALVEQCYRAFVSETEPLAEFLARCRFPQDLSDLGSVMHAMVERHADYLTLVYVDIAEFQGKHVRSHYENLADRFRQALAPRFANNPNNPLPSWADPGVVFTLVYMQFANFFIVEHLIGAKNHLGLDHNEAIRAISQLFELGLAPRNPPVAGGET